MARVDCPAVSPVSSIPPSGGMWDLHRPKWLFVTGVRLFEPDARVPTQAIVELGVAPDIWAPVWILVDDDQRDRPCCRA